MSNPFIPPPLQPCGQFEGQYRLSYQGQWSKWFCLGDRSEQNEKDAAELTRRIPTSVPKEGAQEYLILRFIPATA